MVLICMLESNLTPLSPGFMPLLMTQPFPRSPGTEAMCTASEIPSPSTYTVLTTTETTHHPCLPVMSESTHRTLPPFLPPVFIILDIYFSHPQFVPCSASVSHRHWWHLQILSSYSLLFFSAAGFDRRKGRITQGGPVTGSVKLLIHVAS